MGIVGRLVVGASIWSLSSVIGCGENAHVDPIAGGAGDSAMAGGDSGADGGDSAGGAGAAGSGGSGAAQALAEELCGIKADARMTCYGDYDSYDSRAEYVTGCVEQNPTFTCGAFEPDSLRTLVACHAQCDDDSACVTDYYKAAGDARPERYEGFKACNALIDECYGDADPEGRDFAAQDCFDYFTVNDIGLKRLDACVAGGCDGVANCLDAALCQ